MHTPAPAVATSPAATAAAATPSAATPPAATPTPADIAQALRQQQVRMHGQNVVWAVAGALLIALLLMLALWPVVPHTALLGWLAALLGVVAWRGLLWGWQQRSAHGRLGDSAWLWLYRAGFAVHGLVWAAAGALPLPEQAAMHLALLAVALAGVVASNFILNAFDLTAALLFGVPVASALALRLFASADPVQHTLGGAVLLALLFFAATGRRAHRLVRQNVALRLAEARQNHLLRLLIETTTEGYWFIDGQTNTLDANPAMCQILGRPRESLLGRSIYAFVDAPNRLIFEREVALRNAGQVSGYEIALQRPDGSLVDCFNHATPIHDTLGQRLGAVGLFTDISERKHAERQLQETSAALRQKSKALQDTLGSISQGILSCDGQGQVLAHNQRLLELLALPESLFGPQARQDDLVAYQVARGDLAQDREILDTSGQPLPKALRNSVQALPDAYVRRTAGGVLLEVRTLRKSDGGMVRTFTDVTAYIEAQRALAIDISARKAAEAALVAARDEAERANRAKSQFLSAMSHELRTPLNAILGFGQLLATDALHPLAATQRAQMDEILRGARHLLQLINEVLDLAVVETGQATVHLQTVHLAPVLAEALALVQPLALARGITLHAVSGLLADAAVLADPVRLKQVLLNLLGNAIKYNWPQGQVRLHCEALSQGQAAPGSGGWRITVTDTGPGLDSAQQARLFSPFERLGAEQGSVEGTGLGLALSRGLVRAMGGDIGVHSQPGEGSSFWVRLPPAPPRAALPAPARATLPSPAIAALPECGDTLGDTPGAMPPLPLPWPTPAAAGPPPALVPAVLPSVLYIDDNPVNLLLMEALFARLPGQRLVLASTAEQGLRLATEQRPQLVLTDIELPGMDGFDLLRRMRQDVRTSHIPVLAVSADAMPASSERARQAGFADYLHKPVDFLQLAAAVTAVLARR